MKRQRPMRFLFITRDGFPPYRVDVATLFGRELTRRGHVIDWLLPSQEPCKKSYVGQWEGGRAFVGPSDRGPSLVHKLRNQLLILAHDFKVMSLLRRNEYDFVQIKDKFPSFFPTLLACRLHRRKLFFWLSFPYAEEARLLADMTPFPARILPLAKAAVLDFLFYRFVAPFSDHVFVQSDAMKAHFAAHGVPEDKMTPVPMGISPRRAHEEKAVTIPGKVVYAGSLSRARKVDFLLSAWKRVAERAPQLTLFVVGGSGDPRDEKALRELAGTLGLGNSVVFTGFLPIEEAWRHIREAELCLSYQSSDRVNNLGSVTKIIEYMSFGKPVVANHQPDQLRLVEESGCGLCIPAEEEAFANAVLSVLAEPGRAREMGERGRAYVEAHRSYSRIADRLEAKYFQLLGRAPDPTEMGAAVS